MGDDYDTTRVKESKQKVKKATKVTIEPSTDVCHNFELQTDKKRTQ